MAFGNCRSLKRAHIPATVTTIAGNPFMGCIGVESFDLDRDNAFYTMDENGVLYDKGMFTLLYYPASLTAETFEIPSSVQEIAIGAFSGAQLKHLVVPNQITEIPDYAFQYSDLETVTFHKAITSIGAHAFDGCANLNDVTIYNNIKNLGDYAFANCTSLSNFVFEDVPEGQEGYHIGTHFFDGCTSITQIIVPNEIVFAGAESGTNCMPDYMFANTGIVNAVIPARITDLTTEGVFFNCKQLVSVDFEAKWLSGYNIGELFFYGCSSLKSIEIPCGLGDPFTIGSHSVEGLESSGNYIFGECTSLERVVVYIDYDFLSTGFFTFYNCTSLTSIEVIKVGDVIVDEYGDIVEYTDLTERCFGFVNVGAFQGCISLKDVKMYHGSFAIYGNAFAGSGFETLHLETLRLLEGYDHYGFDDKIFSGMPCLKSIFIGKIFTNTNIFAISQNVFSDVDTEVNVYFYLYTREEVEAFCRGDMKWMENASDKVTFYFKEDLPEGLEIPESLSEIMTETPKDKDDGGGKGDER